jgi:hypothetical protein
VRDPYGNPEFVGENSSLLDFRFHRDLSLRSSRNKLR